MITKVRRPHSMRVLLLVLFAPFILVCAQSQTRLLDNIQVYDATTNKSVKLSKPSGITDNQELVFPSSAGTVGQVLTITAKSGNTLTLGWSTESVSTVTASDRVTGGDQDASAPAGLSVSVAANAKYSYSGVIVVNRNNTGATPYSDNLILSVTGPTNTARVTIAVRCFDCPGSTTGVPAYASAATTTVSTGAIDPAGPPPEYYTPIALAFEGVVETGASTGNIIVTAAQSGGVNNVVVKENSYIVITELE
jgi:hypothetical protein